jgi:hypothetical protein
VAGVLTELLTRSTGPLIEELQTKPALTLLLENALQPRNFSGLRAAMLFITQFLAKYSPGMKIVGFTPEIVVHNKDVTADDPPPVKEVVCSLYYIFSLLYFLYVILNLY